jgi:cytoskeletal protein CcmA (bactofilin family)
MSSDGSQNTAKPASGGGLSQVGRGARVTGTLRGDGTLVVHGTLSGEITLDGHLLVEAAGACDGVRARVGTLRVAGQVRGDVRADADAHVADGGALRGSLATRALETTPDASVDVELTVLPQKS